VCAFDCSFINRTQTGTAGQYLILGPTAVAHAVPTNDPCGFPGCLSSTNTVLFTDLVYTGLVNSSTNLPVNNFVMPQLTDYFPSGNPLRSCTTASLVSYTPNAQPALVKRDAQPVPINTFPGVPALTASSTFIAEPLKVDPAPSTISSDGNVGEDTTTAPPAPSQPQQITQTTPVASPFTSSIAQGSPNTQSSDPSLTTTDSSIQPGATTSSTAPETPSIQAAVSSSTTTEGSILAGTTALGTMTVTGASTQMAGNSSASLASTWNFVCSAQGCTLASSGESTTTSADASSTNTTESSPTTAQSGSVRVLAWHGIGSILFMAVLVAVI